MKEKNKVKKRVFFVIALSLLIIGSFFITLYFKQSKNKINENARLLVVDSYSNYAWGFKFNGTAIFDDGSIYTWYEQSSRANTREYKLGTVEGLKKYILNEGKIKLKKVSDNDLIKIKEGISNLEDTIVMRYLGADQGTKSISVIDENDNKIILESSGDRVGTNQTKEAQELLKIIEKYS